MRRPPAMVAAALFALAAAAPATAGPRVMSLDPCADQFVMALSERNSIVGVSHRADDYDSFLAAKAAGLPRRRATLESALAARPEVVVRYWGGDARLIRRLEQAGATVVTIEDATDFAGVRRNVRAVAAALGRSREGDALIDQMDRTLVRAGHGWSGQSALYLTTGGYTAGSETLIGAAMAAAGLKNQIPGGFAPVPVERLAVEPPRVVVYGFFDDPVRRRRTTAALAARRSAAGARKVHLPASLLGCPAWFAAEAAERLARESRR